MAHLFDGFVLLFIVLAALPMAVTASQLVSVCASTLIGAVAAPATPLPRLWAAELYFIGATTLWHAPLYGWLLLASAWSPRLPMVAAVLPLLSAVAIEAIALDSWHLGAMLHYRWVGVLDIAFQRRYPVPSGNELPELAPVAFLTSPDARIGVLFAAA